MAVTCAFRPRDEWRRRKRVGRRGWAGPSEEPETLQFVQDETGRADRGYGVATGTAAGEQPRPHGAISRPWYPTNRAESLGRDVFEEAQLPVPALPREDLLEDGDPVDHRAQHQRYHRRVELTVSARQRLAHAVNHPDRTGAARSRGSGSTATTSMTSAG